MTLPWRDVFVPVHVVASNDFTAETGGLVVMSLSLFCRYRVASAEPDPGRPISSVSGNHSHPDHRRVYDMIGKAVSIDSCAWPDGWIIDVSGLAIYVSEADARSEASAPTFNVYREAASDPPMPLPQPGAWTRVRGQLAIAEDHETGGYEPEDALLRRAVRSWHVRRIVRLDSEFGEPGPPYRGRSQEVSRMHYGDLRCRGRWRTTGYTLDLEMTSTAEHP